MSQRHPLARGALSAPAPYVAGRSAEAVMKHYGVREVAKLDHNENPLGLSPRVRDALGPRVGAETYKAPPTMIAPALLGLAGVAARSRPVVRISLIVNAAFAPS